MFLSVFDLFKIGIGPSSSHTVGPMVAARRFLDLVAAQSIPATSCLRATLYGSLAFTGKGHGTDLAIVLGFAGQTPAKIDPNAVDNILAKMATLRLVTLASGTTLHFDPATDVVFDYGPALPGHSNGMVLAIIDPEGAILFSETYYSIGGGFVVSETELQQPEMSPTENLKSVPFPFSTAAQMLTMGEASGLSIAEMKRANETVHHGVALNSKIDEIWNAMNSCMERGLALGGTLPGGLKVRRRAADIYAKLKAEQGGNSLQPHRVMDWLSVYAMAVNEENAAGGKVVTAPTNGAAGVMPAVIRYYLDHVADANQDGIRNFLLVSSAIGGIIKHNASISGAEVGCQGEVGSASAMAAAGLCAALGGTNAQIENAAEIALEHHLGMTCDPVGGLVQVPCIERNAFGAVKAVTAASLALRGDGTHLVPLDTCVETMRQTGVDMNIRYKETSTGGLAVNVVEC